MRGPEALYSSICATLSPMFNIIERLLGVITVLFGFRKPLTEAKDERRKKIFDLLDQMAACLDRVVVSLEAHEVPHGACGELATYAGWLPETVGAEIGVNMASFIARELEEAHNVESLLVQLHGSLDERAELAKLWEAAGRLHALINIIRAG